MSNNLQGLDAENGFQINNFTISFYKKIGEADPWEWLFCGMEFVIPAYIDLKIISF